MAVADRNTTAVIPRPGVTALVVYLRPAPRGRLLPLLAELGVFVVERQGADHALAAAFSTRSDFLIVVADTAPEHVALARRLHENLGSVLVVIVPAGAPATAFDESGATAILADDLSDDRFALAIAPAVRQARWERSTEAADEEYVIFGDVHFRVLPPALSRAGRAVSLTRAEADLLAELARALGRPVPTTELERRLTGSETRADPHGGYVKTVVLRIRRKVEEIGADPLLLRNVRGYGYMLSG